MMRRILALTLTTGLVFGSVAPTFASEVDSSYVSLGGKGKGKGGKFGKKGKGKHGKRGKGKFGKKGGKAPAGKGKKVSTTTVV